MRIVDIRKRRGRQYLLTFDTGENSLIDSRTWDESPYRLDSELDEDEWAALLALSRRNRAREKALYLLSMRDHSRVELERKLRDGDNAAEAADAAEHMEELGLVDDARYAERLARDLRLRKSRSRRQTIQELRLRGVDRELAEEAADAVDTTDFEQALALLRKKRYNILDTEDRRRAAGMLMRRGFDGGTTRRAIEAVMQDESPT